jgi:hypothetical protein
MTVKGLSLYERFERKVSPDASGCWMWTGAVNAAGYGVMRSVGKRNHFAHRLSYELHTGPIPDGFLVCHTCDRPGCSRPDHLFIGTHVDNAMDMRVKGRAAKGEARSKLTERDVALIRASNDTSSSIGVALGVTRTTVDRIRHRKTWTHVGSAQDAWTSARAVGARNGRTVLTAEMVRLIRASADSYANLASRFGVSCGAIQRVKQRTSWRHVA